MNKVIAVYDVDYNYSCRLAEALRTRTEFTFQLITFTSEEKLLNYASGHYINLLLVAPSLLSNEVKKISAKKIMVLTNGTEEDLDAIDEKKNVELYSNLNRYQPVTGIVSEMMRFYNGFNEPGSYSNEEKRKVYGIYSPDSFRDREQVIENIIRDYGNHEKVLFVSLEAFAEIAKGRDAAESDLSDAFFYWKQKEYSRTEYLKNMIMHGKDYDYLPAAVFPEDMEGVSKSELIDFLNDLVCLLDYPLTVIDFADYGKDISVLMNLCSKQLIPFYQNGVLSQKKINNYGRYMDMSGVGFWKEKTECIPIMDDNTVCGRQNVFSIGAIS